MRRHSLVLGLVLVFTVFHPAVAQDKPELVRLSFSAGWDALPALVGIERGLFHEEDLIVSGLTMTDPVTALTSVVVGSSDFALVPQRTLLVMAGSELDFKVVALAGWGTQMELVVREGDKGIKSLKDLRKKKIAMAPGSEAFPVLMRLLNQNGLAPSEVEVQYVNADLLPQVFDIEGIDAIIETRHFTTPLLSNKKGRVVLSNQDIVNSIGRIGALPLIANSGLVKDRAEVVQRFLNGWVKSLAYIRQDPEDTARVMRIFFHRQGIKIPNELARAWISMTRYDRAAWSDSDIADAEYNGWGLKTGGILKVQAKLKGYIDNRFAEAAAKKLKQ